MKRNFVVAAVLVSTLSIVQACASDPVAPAVHLESVPVVATTRTAQPSETVPSIDVDSKAGVVSVTVVSNATCAIIVTASIRREPNVLDIVANVGSNPAALCAPIISTAVVEYKIQVAAAPGPQVVNVFESRGGDPAKFLGSKKLFVRAF